MCTYVVYESRLFMFSYVVYESGSFKVILDHCMWLLVGLAVLVVAALTVWNSLPACVKSEGNIVSFRRRLKTYLCNAASPP